MNLGKQTKRKQVTGQARREKVPGRGLRARSPALSFPGPGAAQGALQGSPRGRGGAPFLAVTRPQRGPQRGPGHFQGLSPRYREPAKCEI